MPEKTERTEYRVVPASWAPACYRGHLDQERLSAVVHLAEHRGIGIRIQKRTVTETPWVDCEEESND